MTNGGTMIQPSNVIEFPGSSQRAAYPRARNEALAYGTVVLLSGMMWLGLLAVLVC